MSTISAVTLPCLSVRDQDVITRVRTRGCWATSLGTPRRLPARLHLVNRVVARWQPGKAAWYAARTKCRITLQQVALHIQPPDGIELCDSCALHDYNPHTVYQHLDVASAVLYIGYSAELIARTKFHAKNSPWWPRVVQVAFTEYPERAPARAAEESAIRLLDPPFNREFTPRRRS